MTTPSETESDSESKSHTIRSAACMVERGETIRVELPSGEVVEGKVRARRNTRKRTATRAFHLTHLYFEDGSKRALSQLTMVTIIKGAKQ